jgi:23S rRNA (cytosine1962-C5)-methyltransferase
MSELVIALERALSCREALLARLADEDTNCVRLLHGVAEGAPQITVDRYGPILLVQSWRGPLEDAELASLSAAVDARLGVKLELVFNDRSEGAGRSRSELEREDGPPIGRELGLTYDVRPRHRGQDPLLFLDFRVARRWVEREASGKDVLNLYAYTCGVGVAAAAGGARSVLNVDFARSALDIGQANSERNGVADRCEMLQGDAQVIVRQFAGLPAGGRRRPGAAPPTSRERRTFDVVVLDPPRWAKSAFGAVDVVRDYPSLFKPALLATAPGGVVLASNHVPSVDREGWLAVLRRTAQKAGRPLASIDVLSPDEDFPSFDGAPPLKLAVCRVA